MKDYDFILKYHLGKANKAGDAFSRKEIHMEEQIMLEYNLL